jgi:hypothetical protein
MASSLDSTPHPKREKRQEAKAQRDFIALLNLGSLAIQGCGLFVLLLLFVSFWRLSSRPVPTLVQMADGTAISVKEMGNRDRSPELVQRFTTDSLILLMSWQQKLPSADVAPDGTPILVDDPGIKVETDNRRQNHVTSRAFQASFAFSETFRADLLKMIASMTSPKVFTGQVQTALVFDAVTEPEPIKEGEWRVSVVGRLVQSDLEAEITNTIPFNKEVLLRAVDTPPLPADSKFASPFESAVYAVRQAGLEIYSMKDIEPSASAGG